jgi:hypothetical protein
LAPGETRILHQQQAVGKTHRWSPDDPTLYTLATMIKRSGATTDLTNTAFGFRTLSWPQTRTKDDYPGQFLINGKPFFINGTCDYEHLFGQSHAFSHEEIAARVKWMRLAGFNAFREAHQPHNLYYQQLFDEQGIPFWSQFSAHIWYDTPAFREHFKQLLRQYIRERRNSPSIILWGLQNESVLPKEFAEECTQIIRDHGGAAVPAHINRGHGLLVNLGLFPEEPYFPVCEVRPEVPVNDKLVGNRLRLRSSDAHHLGDILEAVFDLETERFSLGGLFDTLAGTNLKSL